MDAAVALLSAPRGARREERLGALACLGQPSVRYYACAHTTHTTHTHTQIDRKREGEGERERERE